MSSFLTSLGANVRFWHLADMLNAPTNFEDAVIRFPHQRPGVAWATGSASLR